MRRIFISSLLILLVWNAFAYTERNILQQQTTVDQVKEMLVMNRKWVTYPDYTDRPAWDKFFGENKAAVIRTGEEKLNYSWQVVKATDYIEYERSGSRDIMQNPFNANNNALSALVMAELAEGKGRFIDQIINGTFYCCEMTSWALSAHLSAQRSHRSLPDYKENIIDLTVGEVGSMLSWTYYFFHKEFDKVNPVISERLRKELQERVLDPYLQEDRFWWMAFNYKPGDMVNNWNPWCNFNALQCFMLLEDNRDVLAKAVYRTMISVDKFINYNHEDGACEEGPSYWGHAAGKMYDYLQLLFDATGGKVSIFDKPIIRNMGEYISRSYVGKGWVVNFADASAKGGGEESLIYRYGKAIRSQDMVEYAAYLKKLRTEQAKKTTTFQFGTDIAHALQDFQCEKEIEKIPPVHTTPPYTWYPETQFCYMSDKAGFFFAAKGGYNNESHNHNDVGTFSLYLHAVPVFIDAGVGTYTRQTFSNERYTIWTMQSNYHNLPMINGIPQQYGAQFKATEVVFDPKKMLFSTNIATAYPQSTGVGKWIRSYTLLPDQLKITDNFQLKEARENNRINFLTWGKVDIHTPGKVSVEVMGEKVILSYDQKAFEPSLETIALDDPRLSNVWGKEIYRVSLLARKTEMTGNYQFVITQQK